MFSVVIISISSIAQWKGIKLKVPTRLWLSGPPVSSPPKALWALPHWQAGVERKNQRSGIGLGFRNQLVTCHVQEYKSTVVLLKTEWCGTYSHGRLDVLELEEDPPPLLRTHNLQLLSCHPQEHRATQHTQTTHRAEREGGMNKSWKGDTILIL